jgi:hypothetical protein
MVEGGAMTNGDERWERIDAAMDRIAAKHQALAETVEIIAGMQRVNEAKIADLTLRISDLTSLVTRVTGAVESLARIAESHERRLDDLEGR